MAKCPFCEVQEREELILFQDDKGIVAINPDGKIPGQLVVVPKDHLTIVEQTPDYILGHLAVLANKASTAVFEAFGVAGTNIMITNGIAAGQTEPHVGIHIIPRNENDGIALNWNPRQADEEQLSTIELQLKEYTKGVGDFQKEEKQEVIEEKHDDVDQDYLIKHLTRIP